MPCHVLWSTPEPCRCCSLAWTCGKRWGAHNQVLPFEIYTSRSQTLLLSTMAGTPYCLDVFHQGLVRHMV